MEFEEGDVDFPDKSKPFMRRGRKTAGLLLNSLAKDAGEFFQGKEAWRHQGFLNLHLETPIKRTR
jgi:hypothetical protein